MEDIKSDSTNDIKQIKNIISTNLYNQNINDDSNRSSVNDNYTTDEEGEVDDTNALKKI